MLDTFQKVIVQIMSWFQGYHIIVVPQDKARTRTLKVSGFSLKVLMASFVLSVPLVLVSVLSTIHYQNKLAALQRDAYENQQLMANKEELVGKITTLESNLTHMKETLASMGEVMDVDLQNLQMGVGPVSGADLYLPEDEVLSPLKSLDLDAVDLVNNWVGHGQISVDQFNNKVTDLKDQTSYLSKKMQGLFEESKDRIRFASSIPNELPVKGWVTSDFGMRLHPITKSYKLHQGLDIASPSGAAITAPASGVVVYAGSAGGYGQVLVIDHGYGVATIYAHTSRLDVGIGDKVSRGDLIANVGSSGDATGPHLHYEVRVDGIPTNPMDFIAKM